MCGPLRHPCLEDIFSKSINNAPCTFIDLPAAALSSAATLPLMRYIALLAFLTSASLVDSHDGHDHDIQMPMDYVRFPFQATYPGDNEGDLRFTGTP